MQLRLSKDFVCRGMIVYANTDEKAVHIRELCWKQNPIARMVETEYATRGSKS